MIWDAATGESLSVLQGHVGEIHGLALFPNGKLLASCGRDGTFRLWDIDSGNGLRCVDHDVQDGLVKIARQARHRWEVRSEVGDHLGHVFPLVARDRQGAADGPVQVNRLLLPVTGMVMIGLRCRTASPHRPVFATG